jgi:hypothetical protein
MIYGGRISWRRKEQKKGRRKAWSGKMIIHVLLKLSLRILTFTPCILMLYMHNNPKNTLFSQFINLFCCFYMFRRKHFIITELFCSLLNYNKSSCIFLAVYAKKAFTFTACNQNFKLILLTTSSEYKGFFSIYRKKTAWTFYYNWVGYRQAPWWWSVYVETCRNSTMD